MHMHTPRTSGTASLQTMRILAQAAPIMCGFSHGIDMQFERQDSEDMGSSAGSSVIITGFAFFSRVGSRVDGILWC